MNKNLIALFLILILFVCALLIACAPAEPDVLTTDVSATQKSKYTTTVHLENDISSDALPTGEVPDETEPVETDAVPTESIESIPDTSTSAAETEPNSTASIPTSTNSTQTTTRPTQVSTTRPTQKPTARPTQVPTTRPTQIPTVPSTQTPTAQPTVTPTTQPSTTAPRNVYYTVRIRSASMRSMGNVGISIYADETMQQLVHSANTNKNGDVQFQLPYNENYVIVLDKTDIPEGFHCDPFYRFTGNGCMILLVSAPISGRDITQRDFKVGDVIYDFTITDTDGVTHTLSQILQEKEMVILNFFFISCIPCRSEMPYLMDAYEQYKEDVEVLLLDPIPTDTPAKLAKFKEDMGLSCPVASVNAGWARFAENGYPTTIVIDRYGVITLIETGAVTSADPFLRAMAYFTADNYREKFCYAGWSSL